MMKRARRFLALLKKELIQLLKNPKTRMTIFAPPIIQLFLLGYAATMDLKEIPLAILDHGRRNQEIWRQSSLAIPSSNCDRR